MAKVTATAECPVLPAGPVDFDALCAALAAGKDGETAVAEATANNPVPEPVVEEAPAPEAAPVAEPIPAVEAAPVEKEL
jgi:hypothetical protein